MNEMHKKILPYEDIILSPFVLFFARIFRRIRSRGIYKFPLCKKILLQIGVFPIIDHYYEPLFNHSRVKTPLVDDRKLPGIDWNIDEQIELLNKLDYSEELKQFIDTPNNTLQFNIHNDMFGCGDFEYWYSIIRHKKPKKIIEIGCGHSTIIAMEALRKNAEENPSYVCEYTCIEPYEAPWLESLNNITVIRKRVEEMDKNIFQDLAKDDMVFIDSSHIIRPQGDIVVEYLELLPLLRSGVIVHIHDIFSPKDYPEVWVKEEIRLWNEQYLLEAFLTSNREWKIIASLNLLYYKYHELLKSKLPFLDAGIEPRSFYISKR